MTESPEIPEAKDPTERRIAITIAVMAVALSFISNQGDNAKTDAILASIASSQDTTEASNQWAYYQAKSLKEHAYDIQLEVLPLVGEAQGRAEDKTRLIAAYQAKAAKYATEKDQIKGVADGLGKQAKHHSDEASHLTAINNRCDLAALLLQIAIVVASVAILSGWRLFWYAGCGLGLAGACVGVTALLM